MHRMRRWLLYCCLISAAWVGGYCHNRFIDPEIGWISALYDLKSEASDKLEDSHRILVLGGSGIHFGVDTALIEAELGMPSINFGMHAGLGLNALLAVPLKQIQPGDIVLVIPEHGILANDGTGEFSSGFGAARDMPGVGGFRSQQKVQEIISMGMPGSNRLVQTAKRALKAIASRSNNLTVSGYTNILDERGNPIDLPEGNPAPGRVDTPISSFSESRLRHFQQQVKDRGGTLIFALPWQLSEREAESIRIVQHNAEVLGKIAPVLFESDLNLKTDPELFGDTNLHMSEQGRVRRSNELAKAISDSILPQEVSQHLTKIEFEY